MYTKIIIGKDLLSHPKGGKKIANGYPVSVQHIFESGVAMNWLALASQEGSKKTIN